MLDAINALLSLVGIDIHTGYAPTGTEVPYAVHRPLFIGGESVAVNGEVLDWDHQSTIYCCGGSVEAAHNLALLVMNTLQGARVAGTTLDTSMGYTGAQVEGHYESQVTVQLNTGGI